MIPPPDESLLPPRYAPRRPLPPYRYVPGHAPHPTADADGHSYGAPEPDAVYMPPSAWRDNEEYLFGVDLFNRRYYWEAHEAWEAVWHTCDKSATHGLFIQGLIQISAALLRWHMGTERGARKLHREGRVKLERAVAESPGDYMGIPVADWVAEVDRIFEALFARMARGTSQTWGPAGSSTSGSSTVGTAGPDAAGAGTTGTDTGGANAAKAAGSSGVELPLIRLRQGGSS